MKTALEILNQVEPNGELLDTDQALEAMELYAVEYAKSLKEDKCAENVYSNEFLEWRNKYFNAMHDPIILEWRTKMKVVREAYSNGELCKKFEKAYQKSPFLPSPTKTEK